MIDKVIITNFKRFDKVEFDVRGRHVVLAGPNNTGKTTVLQAIAAWSFALGMWRRRNDYNPRKGWTPVPITRQQFTPVSVRNFDLLWHLRSYGGDFEVSVESRAGAIGMTFTADSTEQIYVRPTRSTDAQTLRSLRIDAVFVPAMTGLAAEETEYKSEKVDQFIGRNRPGEVLRNLLLAAYDQQDAWTRLQLDIHDLFHLELLPPDASGADIISEYRSEASAATYDIASAGSGFHQILMLLTYVYTRKGAVLLLDEPDAHLHVFLQESVLRRLKAAAATTGSQIIAATHSEVIIDSVDLDELYVLLDRPVRLVDPSQRAALKDALRVIDHVDLMKARICQGILYLEDYTDLDILRAWADVLNHPALGVLGPSVYWRKTVIDMGKDRPGILSRDHFDALQLARPGFPALQIVDGDSPMRIPSDAVTGTRPPTTRWSRREIESYLVHPAAIERFVESQVGAAAFTSEQRAAVRAKFVQLLTQQFLENPLAENRPAEAVLQLDKAREKLLPPLLTEGGLPAFPYTRYHEIAAQMLPEEIHPEVAQKLDMICRAFGILLPADAPPQPGAPA